MSGSVSKPSVAQEKYIYGGNYQTLKQQEGQQGGSESEMRRRGLRNGSTKLMLHRGNDKICLEAADAHSFSSQEQSLPGGESQHTLLQFDGDNLCKAAGIA